MRAATRPLLTFPDRAVPNLRDPAARSTRFARARRGRYPEGASQADMVSGGRMGDGIERMRATHARIEALFEHSAATPPCAKHCAARHSRN
jgi:hypothetical protein